jgi:hypothetical protein
MSWRPIPTCRYCGQSVGEPHWQLFEHASCQLPIQAELPAAPPPMRAKDIKGWDWWQSQLKQRGRQHYQRR